MIEPIHRGLVANNPPVERAGAMVCCLECGVALGEDDACLACGRSYPERDGVREAIGPLAGRNQVAAAFYDGPGWKRFRRWERLFLALQGGQRRARMQILRHLPNLANAQVLEVGIGEGENVPHLPRGWQIHGVDIARLRLMDCVRQFPSLAGRLVLAEGEALPFGDACFDACMSIGGFNFFRDHQATLREMQRVTRPGGVVIVADEAPWLHRLGIGHLVGLPRIDAYWLRWLGLDRDFADMVLDCRLDLDQTFGPDQPDSRRFHIWGGLGYCVVQQKRNNDNSQGETSNVDDR